jgi:predicted transcriptional regulator YdeE
MFLAAMLPEEIQPGRVFLITREWLPGSGFKQAAPYDFERYDARFKGADNDESLTDICVPIQ